jgi:hypothetical protein
MQRFVMRFSVPLPSDPRDPALLDMSNRCMLIC